MNTETIIFAKAQTLLNQKTYEIVSEISRFSSTRIAVSSRALEAYGLYDRYPEAYFLSVDLDRPIELQNAFKGLHENLSFVIFDLEFKSCALSYRYPLTWVHSGSFSPERLSAIEVIHRSSFVVGPSSLNQEFDIQPNRFFEIENLNEGDIDSLINAKPRNPHRGLHFLLLSEMAINEELYDSALEKLGSEIPLWLQNDISHRLSLKPDIKTSNSLREEINVIPQYEEGLYSIINEVQNISSLEVLIDYNSRLSSSDLYRDRTWFSRVVGQKAIEIFLTSIGGLSDRELEEKKAVLLGFVNWDLIPLKTLINFTETIELPDSFYRELSCSQKINASILGTFRAEQTNHRLGSKVDQYKLDSIINLIDHSALDEDLWMQGLKIWGKISSQKWDPLSENPEIELETANRCSPEEVAELNAQANTLFYNGSYSTSLNYFRRVRIVSKKNRQFSTERASRLNIGKVLAAQGHPKKVWEPYLASVLNEVGPSDSLTHLRFLLMELLLEIEEANLHPVKKAIRKIYRKLQRPSYLSVRIIRLAKIVRRIFRLIFNLFGKKKRAI